MHAVSLPRDDDEPMIGAVLKSLKDARAPVAALTLGVSGRAGTLRYNLLPPVPEWRLELIVKYETEELAGKAGETLSYAYRKLDVPESQSEDVVLLMGLGKDSLIEPAVAEIAARGGRARLALPNTLGLYHAYRRLRRAAADETVLLADIGALETHIVLATGERLLFARTVNYGGTQIDEAIASALGIKVEAARKLKEGIEAGRAPQHLVDSAQSAIRSALGQLLAVLQSSITFCRTQVKIPSITIQRVYLSGGATRLPQLASFLRDGLGLAIEILRPQLAGKPLPGATQEWVTAFGLAVAQLDRDRVTLDLLPPAARKVRDFREKTRFLIAAGLALGIGLALSFGVALYQRHVVEAARERVSDDEARVRRLTADFERARAENAVMNAKYERLFRELTPTRFTAQLLAALRTDTPSAISIDELTTVRAEVDGAVGFEVVIRGKADNAERKAIPYLEALQNQLARLPGVERVKVNPGELDQGFRPFELVISPDRRMPERKDGGKDRRSRP
ncbi:MAG: pilus assembly protein PilM [Planctomycetes bacterium]|nr:pilus assembly protein PilM [Planctomycetota bacterium]